MVVRRDQFYGTLPLRHDAEFTIRFCSARVKARKRIKPQGLVLVIAMVFFAFRRVFWSSKPSENDDAGEKPHTALSRHRFPSLQYPLEHAEIVALFFGASWDMETRLLRDIFTRDPRLLPPEGVGSRKETYPLAIVYISVDETEGSSEWIHVRSKKEQTSLKKKFKTDSQMKDNFVEMKQEFQIPSLFVIDATTKSVITLHGMDDIKKNGSDAIKKWLQVKGSMQDVNPAKWAANSLFHHDDNDDGGGGGS